MVKVCPICRSKLWDTTIVKYRDGGGVKVIGTNLFCSGRDCNFERDVR
jgi:hypothetical protein